MSDEFDRLKAWQERMAARRDTEHVSAREASSENQRRRGEPPFRFDRAQGLLLLKFPAGFERQYENHLGLVRHLRKAGVYPRLDIVAYSAKSPSAGLSRFIALTGSSSEIGRLDRVFYDPAAEAFVATHFANNWNAISPKASVSNVAAPGCTVDVNGLERDLRAIEEEIASQLYEKASVD